MGDMDFKTGFIRYLLKVILEKPDPASVAPTIVTGDIDPFSVGKCVFPKVFHHARTLSPANSGVSWLMPRLIKPVLLFST